MDAATQSNPTTTALLEQLRDVATPAPASWWPPAPGWWLIVGAIGFALFLLFRLLRNRRRKRMYRREASILLETLRMNWHANHDSRAYLIAAHQLIRRAAIHVAGRNSVSRLTGPLFIEHVNTLSASTLSSQTGKLITETGYRPESDPTLDVESVHRELESWLTQLESPRRA